LPYRLRLRPATSLPGSTRTEQDRANQANFAAQLIDTHRLRKLVSDPIDPATPTPVHGPERRQLDLP